MKNRKIRYGLKLKFSVFITILICLIIIPVGILTVRNEKQVITNQTIDRGQTLVKNFALSSSSALLFGDLGLDDIAETYIREKGVESAYIVLEDGTYISHSDFKKLGKKHNVEKLISVSKDGLNYHLVRNENNELVYVFYYPVPQIKKQLPGIANIEISYNVVKKAVRDVILKLVAIFVAASLIGIAGSFLLAYFLSSRIRILSDAVQMIGSGDLSYRIKSTTNDELGILSDEINLMTKRLLSAQKLKIKQERIDEELNIASQIQNDLIPKELPKIKGFQSEFYYATSREVGGDYFDFIDIGKNRFAIVVADVSGKGIPAALVMSMCKGLFRTTSPLSPDLSMTLSNINSFLCSETKPGMFVTAIYGILYQDTKKFVFANCGHEPLLYYSASEDKFIEYKPKGVALGIEKSDTEFRNSMEIMEIVLCKSDLMLMFTDGLTDTADPCGDFFEIERVKSSIKPVVKFIPKRIILELTEKVNSFRKGGQQKDDIAIVALKNL